MLNLKNIEIPEGVVNPKEYIKMLVYEKHPTIRNTIYIASNGKEINVGMLPHYLKSRIADLPEDEQEDILELKRQYNVMRAKITLTKAMAYGRMGRYGGKKKEETPAYRLTPFEEDIIELLGRLFTVKEVMKIMVEDYKIEATEDEIKAVLKKHILEIERKRDEFRNKVADVRLFNKRPRLEELAWMYSKMKSRFIALNNTDTYKALLSTLEQIRKESEGDVINFKGSLDVNVEMLIQEQIHQEAIKTINLKEVILGRVAARMNTSPMNLVASLHNSYYAKFVEISGELDNDAEMKYPSLSPYDFDKIERDNHNVVQIDDKPQQLTQAEKSSANLAKNLFLEKIKKQKEEMQIRQAEFNVVAEDNRPIAGEEEEVYQRGQGRAKDKIPPSRTAEQKIKKNKRDYKTGKRK